MGASDGIKEVFVAEKNMFQIAAEGIMARPDMQADPGHNAGSADGGVSAAVYYPTLTTEEQGPSMTMNQHAIDRSINLNPM